MSSVGSIADFTPTANYGFYLENVQSPNTSYTADYFWFMNDSLDYTAGTGLLDAGTQHFTVFSGTNSFYLGMEDTPAPTSDFDYNDMIINVQAVPEPASIALMAGGIGVLGVIRRRRAQTFSKSDF
jgi:hypothetical protein